ncbi:MAG: hypothetical protein M1119_05905 [Firmicutes bacterium]|nr:hypothetical protein [Bacillota bacterium]
MDKHKGCNKQNQEVTIKIMQNGSVEECNKALSDARRFLFNKIITKMKKSEYAC